MFQGGAFEDELLEITEIDAELWQTARAELEAAALVSVESIPGVTPPFLRFHPTLLPYLRAQLADEQRAALEARYWQRYYALANYLYHADTQTPHQARAIAAARAAQPAPRAGAGPGRGGRRRGGGLCGPHRQVPGHLWPLAGAGGDAWTRVRARARRRRPARAR